MHLIVLHLSLIHLNNHGHSNLNHVLVLVFGFLFGPIVFSVNNVLKLGAFDCSSLVINLCELPQPFSSDSFEYCS